MGCKKITLQRWIAILAYGFLAAVFIEVISQIKWATEFSVWWSNTFNSFDSYSQRAFLIISGWLVFQFLLKMNVYSEKAPLTNWFLYPPITFSVLPAIASFIYFLKPLTIINVWYFLSSEQAINLYCLFAWLVIINIYHFRSSLPKKVQQKNEVNKVPVTSNSTYEEYKAWFYDDSPISNMSQLSEELQPYAERISTYINDFQNNNKSVHLSLCGDFGSGKSSIIECVAKKLDPKVIHSNIDTWGTDTKSINTFVLTKIVDDVAQYADMSALKSLPYQYLEALKLGNNTSKLLAIFSARSTDSLQGLNKLNSVLGTINKKLLITIQDIDRCLEPQKTTDELAALLDKLKGLNNISFIIALGYNRELSGSIRKVCDYREDIIKDNYKFKFIGFIQSLSKKSQREGVFTADSKGINLKLNIHSNKYSNPYDIISSERSFKHICRRIDFIWQKDKLMGEVDIESLSLLMILREEYPLIFESLINNAGVLKNAINDLNIKGDENSSSPNGLSIEQQQRKRNSNTLNECAMHYPSMGSEKLTAYFTYLFQCTNKLGQGALSSNHKYCNYLNRVLLESVLSTEIKDQEVLTLFKNIDKKGSVETLIDNFKSRNKGGNWIEAYNRFSANYFNPTNLVIYETIYIQMIDYYYEDTVQYIKDRKIHFNDTQDFLILLLNKCLTSENVHKLFKVTLKVPEILTANISFHSLPNIFYYLDLFLQHDQEKKLYPFFIEQFKVSNDLIDKLANVDSSIQALVKFIIFMIEKEHQGENAKELYLWKEIILAFIGKNNKEKNAYQFGLYFICYFVNAKDPLEKVFSSDELLLIRTELQQLEEHTIKIYLGDDQKSTEENYQKLLVRLEHLKEEKVLDS